jgi:hypothetical protein
MRLLEYVLVRLVSPAAVAQLMVELLRTLQMMYMMAVMRTMVVSTLMEEMLDKEQYGVSSWSYPNAKRHQRKLGF